MFHRKHDNDDNVPRSPRRGGLFSRFHHNKNNAHPNAHPGVAPVGQYSAYGSGNGYYGPSYGAAPQYLHGSTVSDWDHYGVRHEEALIGDPVPIVHNGLNLATGHGPDGRFITEPTYGTSYGPGGNVAPVAHGRRGRGMDDGHYYPGPVVANGPIGGNYSSGTVLERHVREGPGAKSRRSRFALWGSEPVFADRGYGVGGEGYQYRDARDRTTPLLPDNPWTHNELGRDYVDSYRAGTLPYNAINNTYIAPATVTRTSAVGPNGELIETTTSAVVREELLPPAFAPRAEQIAQSTTREIIKDEVYSESGVRGTGVSIPITGPMGSQPVAVHEESIRQTTRTL